VSHSRVGGDKVGVVGANRGEGVMFGLFGRKPTSVFGAYLRLPSTKALTHASQDRVSAEQ
jgi:hypothetical protein